MSRFGSDTHRRAACDALRRYSPQARRLRPSAHRRRARRARGRRAARARRACRRCPSSPCSAGPAPGFHSHLRTGFPIRFAPLPSPVSRLRAQCLGVLVSVGRKPVAVAVAVGRLRPRRFQPHGAGAAAATAEYAAAALGPFHALTGECVVRALDALGEYSEGLVSTPSTPRTRGVVGGLCVRQGGCSLAASHTVSTASPARRGVRGAALQHVCKYRYI